MIFIQGRSIHRSQKFFRQTLDSFRFKLFNNANEIAHERKVDDLVRWTQESGAVWASLTENDGLKMAKDLRGEIELRETIYAVMKFGRIMSQANLFDEGEGAEVANPLLKDCKDLHESLAQYQKIPPEKRFFK